MKRPCNKMASSFVSSSTSRNAEPFAQKQAIKKVIDYKIDNGRRYYKVKWECSWEAEENLLEYQNLVDQFWGFVNRVKSEDSRTGLSQVQSDDSENATSQDSTKAGNPKLITLVTAAPTKIGDATLKPILPNNLKPGSDSPKTKDLTQKLSPGICFTRDSNDIQLHWDNPYVRIAFFCRVCCMEEPFCQDQPSWKLHFMSHVTVRSEDESNLTEQTEMLTEADKEMFKDPDQPWIQKVEHLIQKWGVNQYVRLAFLCRICGKEQQAQHTGNWRNHHMSHRVNRPFPCQTCSKTFKSKQELKRHKLTVHEDREPENTRVQSCRICFRQFKRRFDMKRHIAQVHNIDPEHLTPSSPDHLDCEAIQPPVKVLLVSDTQRLNRTPEGPGMPIATGDPDNDKLIVYTHKFQGESRYKSVESIAPSMKTSSNTFDEVPIPVSSVDSTDDQQVNIAARNAETKRMSESTIPVTNSTPRNFVCCACFQTFPSKNELYKHQKKSPGCQDGDEQLRVHVCKICGRGFKRKYDMNRHTSNVHCMQFEQAKLVNTSIDSDVVGDGQFASMCVVKPSDRDESCQPTATDEMSTHDELLERRDDNPRTTPDEVLIVIKAEEPDDDERPCLEDHLIEEEEKHAFK